MSTNKKYITDEEYREAACKRVDGMADICIWTEGDVKYVTKEFGTSTNKVAEVKRNRIGAYVQAWIYVQDNWVEESGTYCPESAKCFSVEGQNARSFREGAKASSSINKLIEDIKGGE